MGVLCFIILPFSSPPAFYWLSLTLPLVICFSTCCFFRTTTTADAAIRRDTNYTHRSILKDYFTRYRELVLPPSIYASHLLLFNVLQHISHHTAAAADFAFNYFLSRFSLSATLEFLLISHEIKSQIWNWNDVLHTVNCCCMLLLLLET